MSSEIARIRLLAKMTYREYQRRQAETKKITLEPDVPIDDHKKRARRSDDPDVEKFIVEQEKQELEAIQKQQTELDTARQSESVEILRREIASLKSSLQQKPRRPDEKEIIAAKMARMPPPELPQAPPQKKYSLDQFRNEMGQWHDDFFGERQQPTQRKSGKLFDYFGGT